MNDEELIKEVDENIGQHNPNEIGEAFTEGLQHVKCYKVIFNEILSACEEIKRAKYEQKEISSETLQAIADNIDRLHQIARNGHYINIAN